MAAGWLDGLVEVVPTAIVAMGSGDGQIAFANQAARDLFAFPSAGTPSSLDDVVGPGALKAAGRATETGEPQELMLPGRGGITRFELDSRASPDQPDLLVVTIRDSSTLRRVDQQISDLARFPEKNPGPVVWLDRSSKVLLANVAARRNFGEELVGSRWLDVCPGFDGLRLAEILASTDTVALETQVGDTWFSIAYVRSDADGFIFGFGTDVTKRREMEQRVLEYARFPDMNPGPVLRVDLAGQVLLANVAARAVFATEVVGASWFDFYPGSRQRWEEILVAEKPISLEARIGERDYVFAHRGDPETQLVFVFGADITQQKQAEGLLRQSEKMATLGTLVAGVAHELNNPAAATKRAADHLGNAFARLEQAHRELSAADFDASGRAQLAALDQRARALAREPTSMDSLTRSDLEFEVEDWLADRDLVDDFDLASPLVEQGLTREALDDLGRALGEAALKPTVRWVAAAFPVYRLAHEIGEGSARISEIVAALKSYSYLGQAPVQTVDVHEGIDNTLVIMRSKLSTGVEVHREYAPDLPQVTAYGSELNQVWTNLIDNAVDALGGRGTITIRTRLEDASVIVEIEDDGPGIADSALSRVFDPFFTTKEPGKGTGLGLATSYSIVRDKHHGSIAVRSAPGSTCFTVRLPIDAPPPRERQGAS